MDSELPAQKNGTKQKVYGPEEQNGKVQKFAL